MTAPSSPAPRTAGGALLVLIGTAISGLAGYGVTIVAFRSLGATDYAVFAVFWASLYLLVGGLSGIQQEFTRATSAREPSRPPQPSRARNFGVIAAVALFVAVLATSPLWSSAVFVRDGSELAIPLALGSASYVVVATLAGSLFGMSQWRSIFLLIVTDGLLRFLLVVIALSFTHDLLVIAWAVATPFPAAIILLWWFVRGGLVGRTLLDVGYRALTFNVARTVLASISTAVMVSGFPLILGIVGKSSSAHYVGELIFAITIARAPLIVAVGSLQSIFVVRFRDATNSFWRPLAIVLGVLLGGGALLALLAVVVGSPVLEWIQGGHSSVTGPFIGVLVASSALVAAITVSGSAVLSQSHHLVYTLGWVLAAVVTIAVMAAPGDLTARVALALTIAPATGLVFHLLSLAWLRRGHVAARVQK